MCYRFSPSFSAHSQTYIHTQPWPINIWAIKDPTLKGVGHRRACGLTHGAGGNLHRQGYLNYWGLPHPPPPTLNTDRDSSGHDDENCWCHQFQPPPLGIMSWHLRKIKTHSNQLADWHKGKPVVSEKTNCAWIRGNVCGDEKAFLLIKGGESLRLSCKLRDILSEEVAI